jgi:hypothetical protein
MRFFGVLRLFSLECQAFVEILHKRFFSNTIIAQNSRFYNGIWEKIGGFFVWANCVRPFAIWKLQKIFSASAGNLRDSYSRVS